MAAELQEALQHHQQQAEQKAKQRFEMQVTNKCNCQDVPLMTLQQQPSQSMPAEEQRSLPHACCPSPHAYQQYSQLSMMTSGALCCDLAVLQSAQRHIAFPVPPRLLCWGPSAPGVADCHVDIA
jgi:hypothetical protein